MLTSVKEIMAYVTGGNAIFTLVSPRTGRRYTYKMLRSKSSPSQYEIRMLQGDDNTDSKQYHFIGRFYDEDKHKIWFASVPTRWATYKLWPNILSYSEKAISWVLLKTQQYLDKGLQFWMSGHCAKCGRLLTDPESIVTGFGPHCGGRR